MRFTLRVSLPDKPGHLGLLAGALGEGGANIITLDVVAREDGYAVDDLTVEAPRGMTEALKLASTRVPGLIVEMTRPSDAFRTVMTPMELAAALATTDGLPLDILVRELPGALHASWSMIVSDSEPRVLASSVGALATDNIETPWMPVDSPRRLDLAEWMPPAWRLAMAAGLELAAAQLETGSAIIVGRRKGPRFRSSELHQLGLIASIASAALSRDAKSIEARGTETVFVV